MRHVTKKEAQVAAIAMMKRDGITKHQFRKNLELAKLWHNPMNWTDNGRGLAEKHGWEYMFGEARAMEGLGKSRYYFPFKDVDFFDFEVVMNEFLSCKNYKPYLRVWQKHAPKEFCNEIYFLISLTEITVKGMVYEAREIERRGLIPSTFEEDYGQGIDAYTQDGIPVQIKSPATQQGM